MENLKGIYVKADALIPVEIPTPLLERIQRVLVYLLINKDQKEIESLKERLSNSDPKEFDESTFEYQILTLLSLIKMIETKAIESGMTIEKLIE